MGKQVRSKKKPAKHKAITKKPDPNGNTKQRKWITRSIEWMKEGWSVKMIKDAIIAQKEGGMARSTIEKIVFEANRMIISEFSQDRASVTSVHVKRYNRQIKRLLAVRDDDIIDPETGETDFIAGRKKKGDALWSCLDTMYLKEKLLQYHNKNFRIIINNEEEVEINLAANKKTSLDISKLTFEEQIELHTLMNKAKKTDDELSGVKLNVINEENTIDIDHEVITDTNLDKIKQTNITQVKKPGITLEEAAEKLRRAQQRKAIKDLQEKGAKIDPRELQ